MKGPDLDRIRSEKSLSRKEFLAAYNADLPAAFPQASDPILKEFSKRYPELFKNGDLWTLDVHRKRLMDWLPAHMRAQQ